MEEGNHMELEKDDTQYTHISFTETLHLLHKNNRKYLNDRLSDYNLNLVQSMCLLTIDETENISQKELSVKLCLTKSGITKSVNNLKEEGYLLKQKSPDDERQFILQLTEKGERIIPILNEIKREWASKLGLNDVNDEFIQSLETLTNNAISLNIKQEN